MENTPSTTQRLMCSCRLETRDSRTPQVFEWKKKKRINNIVLGDIETTRRYAFFVVSCKIGE